MPRAENYESEGAAELPSALSVLWATSRSSARMSASGEAAKREPRRKCLGRFLRKTGGTDVRASAAFNTQNAGKH